MKYLMTLLLTILYWPVSTHAACEGQVFGRTAKVGVSLGSEDGCGGGKYLITYWYYNQNDKRVGGVKKVPFDEECKATKNGGFTCNANGRTPLAGSTYEVTKDAVDPCDESGKARTEQYTCVKGCDSSIVPKHIEIRPYEC